MIIKNHAKHQLPAALAMSLPSCVRTAQTGNAFAGLVARGRHAAAGKAACHSGSFSWTRLRSVTD